MKVKLYSESVYTGKDMQEFNRVRELLETAGIVYRYKVNNRLGGWAGIGSGAGTFRSNFGSAGIAADKMYEYDLRVRAEDYKQAAGLLGQLER